MITVLVLLGQVLELRAREATSGAIRALLDLAPKTARRVNDDGSDSEVPLDTVARGRPAARPARRQSASRRRRSGRALVARRIDGDRRVDAGQQRQRCTCDWRHAQRERAASSCVPRRSAVTRCWRRSCRWSASAQRSRAPIQRLADHVSAWFVPLVIVAAVVAFGAWAVYGPEPRFAYGLVAAVSVLIIACPCALGLATPMSIMVGVGRGAQAGVLIKNAEALERMEKVDTLVVDKTGTLTQGKPKVTARRAGAGLRRGAGAAACRQPRTRQRASARRRHRRRRGGAQSRRCRSVDGFDAPAGKGVVGIVEGKRLALGNADYLRELGIDDGALCRSTPSAPRQDGATAIFLAVNGQPPE